MEICKFVHLAYLAPRWCHTHWNFTTILPSESIESRAIVQHCLHENMFIHSDSTVTCDEQTQAHNICRIGEMEPLCVMYTNTCFA